MITVLPEFEEDYYDKIKLGKSFLKDKSIVVVGLARNIENILYPNIASIGYIKQYCKQLNYFIYENDSTDNTRAILQECKKNIPNFHFQSDTLNLKSFNHLTLESKLELKSIERTQNLAKHRNTCLSYIKNNFSESDFIIVMDMDFEKFSLDGLLNSFGWFSIDWADALVGNAFQSKRIFATAKTDHLWNYDSWAYRGSWWKDLQKYGHQYDYDPMLWFGFWQLPIGSSPVQVNSAFGGIGIYKTSHYINSEYDGYDCEHVCFHKNLYTKYTNYKLCINPSQIMLFS